MDLRFEIFFSKNTKIRSKNFCIESDLDSQLNLALIIKFSQSQYQKWLKKILILKIRKNILEMPLKRRPIAQKVEKKTIPRDGLDCLKRIEIGKGYLSELYQSNQSRVEGEKRLELSRRFSVLDVIKQSFVENAKKKEEAWNNRQQHYKNYRKFIRPPLGRVWTISGLRDFEILIFYQFAFEFSEYRNQGETYFFLNFLHFEIKFF